MVIHDVANMTERAKKHLGYLGAMIGASKGRYRDKHPKNLIVFNSNVICAGHKIWYGDLDITKDLKKLQALSKDLGDRELYVLSEMDGRFEYEKTPRIDRHICMVTPISVTLGRHLESYWYNGKKVIAREVPSSRPDVLANPIRLYKPDELRPVSKLPAISTFKATSAKQSEYPYDKFYRWLRKSGFKAESVSQVVISVKSDEQLKKLVAQWLKKYHKMDAYDVRKNLGYLWLSDSPCTFTSQDGLKDSWVYRKISG